MAGCTCTDESQRGSYLLVTAVVEPVKLAQARTLLRGLLLPGERRVHFQSESDRRRRAIVSQLTEAGLQTWVYVSAGKAEAARSECLTRLVNDVVEVGAQRLVLESRGQHRDKVDRLVIGRTLKGGPSMSYEHLRPHEEPLLWIPDAVAWCWGAGGTWRRQMQELVDRAVDLH